MCGETLYIEFFMTDDTVLIVDNSSVDLKIISSIRDAESVVDRSSIESKLTLGVLLFAVHDTRVEVLLVPGQFSPHFRLQAKFCQKTVSTIRHRLKPYGLLFRL